MPARTREEIAIMTTRSHCIMPAAAALAIFVFGLLAAVRADPLFIEDTYNKADVFDFYRPGRAGYTLTPRILRRRLAPETPRFLAGVRQRLSRPPPLAQPEQQSVL